jgi:hypothetical protein
MDGPIGPDLEARPALDFGSAVHTAVVERLRGPKAATVPPVRLTAEELVKSGLGSHQQGWFKLKGGKTKYNSAGYSYSGMIRLEKVVAHGQLLLRTQRRYVPRDAVLEVLVGQEALAGRPGGVR